MFSQPPTSDHTAVVISHPAALSHTLAKAVSPQTQNQCVMFSPRFGHYQFILLGHRGNRVSLCTVDKIENLALPAKVQTSKFHLQYHKSLMY